VKQLRLKPGFAGSLHRHAIKDEVFYIINGFCNLELQVEHGFETVVMGPGDFQRILPGTLHRFTNWYRKDCVILEASTHHDDADVERFEPSAQLSGS
jgi:uncharacterized cupin superfamily protein